MARKPFRSANIYIRSLAYLVIAVLIVLLTNQLVKVATQLVSKGQTPQTFTVTYTNNVFSPANLTIQAGNTIIWQNTGTEYLELASDPHPQHTDYPLLNLGIIEPGSSKQLTFPQPGTYGYHNHLLASATGKIFVTALSPSPTPVITPTPGATPIPSPTALPINNPSPTYYLTPTVSPTPAATAPIGGNNLQLFPTPSATPKVKQNPTPSSSTISSPTLEPSVIPTLLPTPSATSEIMTEDIPTNAPPNLLVVVGAVLIGLEAIYGVYLFIKKRKKGKIPPIQPTPPQPDSYTMQ